MDKKDAIANEQTFAAAPTSKKISFFSAMLIVMGSSIGAGIFFKAKGVLENSQGNLIFAIFAWLLAAFAVIAMALALLEVASARNDNLSLIGWTKTFNSRTIYKASKNFMFYIYLPLTYFFMPFYVIMSLQDAIVSFGGNPYIIGDGTGSSADWTIWFVISLAISAYFIFVSGMSSRAGNIMNKIIMSIKFIPLIMVPVLAFMVVGMGGAKVEIGLPNLPTDDVMNGGSVSVAGTGISGTQADPSVFGRISPFLGIFLAIGGIFFAYDGFYATAGIQSEMKEPKKTPMAILFGLGATTAVYLLIAISMSLMGNGGLGGFANGVTSATKDHAVEQQIGNAPGFLGHVISSNFTVMNILTGIINLTVAIGVLGIINGFAMWAPRFTEDLIKEHELPFSEKVMNKLNDNKPMVGIMYSCAISLPVVLLFTIIGAYGYQAVGIASYSEDGELFYGSNEMSGIYGFSDLMGTWTAVIAFAFIMLPIAGCLKNRRSNFVQTEKNKHFVWSAYVTVIIVGLALSFLVIEAFYNLFWLTNWIGSGSAGKDNDEIISRVMKVVMLFVFMGLSFAPTMIEDKLHIKKYGSIEAYEKALGITPTYKTATFKF